MLRIGQWILEVSASFEVIEVGIKAVIWSRHLGDEV